MDKVIGVIGVVVFIYVFLGLLFAFPVMWLWNGCLVPAVPAVANIGWLQAWGIMILTSMLFKTTSYNNQK